MHMESNYIVKVDLYKFLGKKIANIVEVAGSIIKSISVVYE